MDSIILVYLDNCCYNRPYDDQSPLSIFLETQAKLAIQEFIRNKKLNLVWSYILDLENGANPDESVRNKIDIWRSRSSIVIYQNNSIIECANHLTSLGFGKKDALHIACAIESKAGYFITTDKDIIKKKKSIKEINILGPIEFIKVMEENYEN